MNTEILPHGAAPPPMTAEHMRRAIHDAFRAYETGDRSLIEQVLAEELSFTSPYDDHIDRATYFERCWPNHQTLQRFHVERIFVEGDAAYVTYLAEATDGRRFLNTEHMVFRGGKIARITVFFGPEYRGVDMTAKAPVQHRH